MNFAKSQKSVLVAAVIHECGLQGGLDPHDFGKINVSFNLAAVGRFAFNVFQLVPVNNHNPCFFRISVVNQHSFNHK